MVEGAQSYELVVYQVGENGEDTKPVLQQTFAGSVSGWTPALDRCLERGGQYAWSVRAEGSKAASDWSPPNLFEVAAGSSEAELEEAVAVVRQYFNAQGTGAHHSSSGELMVLAATRDVDLGKDVQVDREPLNGPTGQGIRIEGKRVLSGFRRELKHDDFGCGAGSECTLTASCSTSEVVLGGGVSVGNSPFVMVESYPSSESAWFVTVKNTGGVEHTFDVWITCAESL